MCLWSDWLYTCICFCLPYDLPPCYCNSTDMIWWGGQLQSQKLQCRNDKIKFTSMSYNLHFRLLVRHSEKRGSSPRSYIRLNSRVPWAYWTVHLVMPAICLQCSMFAHVCICHKQANHKHARVQLLNASIMRGYL